MREKPQQTDKSTDISVNIQRQGKDMVGVPVLTAHRFANTRFSYWIISSIKEVIGFTMADLMFGSSLEVCKKCGRLQILVVCTMCIPMTEKKIRWGWQLKQASVWNCTLALTLSWREGSTGSQHSSCNMSGTHSYLNVLIKNVGDNLCPFCSLSNSCLRQLEYQELKKNNKFVALTVTRWYKTHKVWVKVNKGNVCCSVCWQ